MDKIKYRHAILRATTAAEADTIIRELTQDTGLPNAEEIARRKAESKKIYGENPLKGRVE